MLELYPRDIVDRVRKVLERHPHGTGAYSQSPGIPFIRQAVADFITRRDGIPADRDHIILTDGASKGAQAVLMALLRSSHDGVLIPIPQYPLYSATLALYGGRQIGYYLDEENGWQLDKPVLAASVEKAERAGTKPVAIVVINPGNPTGSVLSRDNIEMIIRFAREHRLAIIADEVYQENVYDRLGRFPLVCPGDGRDAGNGTRRCSASTRFPKGFLGECGHRGGYLEIRNVPEEVMRAVHQTAVDQPVRECQRSVCDILHGGSAGTGRRELCRRTPGSGTPSSSALKRKAEILGEGVNGIPGMSLDMPQGAMYAFVRFELPPEQGVDLPLLTPEDRKCMKPGGMRRIAWRCSSRRAFASSPAPDSASVAGTLHFRTTFLPPQEEIEDLVKKLKMFHEQYTRTLQEA